MAIKKSTLDIDLGETNLENLFIKAYMKNANEIQLKVYITGLYLYEQKYKNNDIYSISEELNIAPIEVKKAYKYWESLGLIKIDNENSQNPLITYVGAKNLYITSMLNLSTEESEKSRADKKISDTTYEFKIDLNEESSKVFSVLRNLEVNRFFEELEMIKNSPINPNDREKIAKLMYKFGATHDLIKQAFKITYEEKNIYGIGAMNYIKGIIENWSKDNITTIKDQAENVKLKNELVKSLGVSGQLLKSDALSTFINKWRNKIESDNLLIAIANYSAKNSNNPNINRLENLMLDINNTYSLTTDGFNKYKENRQNKKTDKNTKQNQIGINDKYKNVTNEELDFLKNKAIFLNGGIDE
ncbi:MAG: hypothetical protein CSB15_00200 [Clostridiales bacterium]|nr:MAG: hypothetical protein CSB15_00200 [Clostridiales bacterium]